MLFAVRNIYRNNLDRLDDISLIGRLCSKNQKKKMSPMKAKVSKEMFTETLDALDLENDEKIKRTKRLNILINMAIQNTSNSDKNDLSKLNKAINSNQLNFEEEAEMENDPSLEPIIE